jgi:hypothetical protein
VIEGHLVYETLQLGLVLVVFVFVLGGIYLIQKYTGV